MQSGTMSCFDSIMLLSKRPSCCCFSLAGCKLDTECYIQLLVSKREHYWFIGGTVYYEDGNSVRIIHFSDLLGAETVVPQSFHWTKSGNSLNCRAIAAFVLYKDY